MSDEREEPTPAGRLRPLWPYAAVAAGMVVVGGALRLEQRPWAWALRFADVALLAAYAYTVWKRALARSGDDEEPDLRDPGLIAAGVLAFLAAVTGLLVVTGLLGRPTSAAVGLVARGFVALSAIRRATRGGHAGGYELQFRSLRPVHATLASFALAIGVGWALLTLPWATPGGAPPISPLDGLFTATSATCVTGLIVKDTPHDFSLFGHMVILLLIQIGGLGIMTFAALFDIIRRRGLSVRRRMIVGDLAGHGEHAGLRGMLSGIVIFTLSAEFAGAVALWLRWRGSTGSFAGDLYLSLFHSISAFCNAGFSLFSDSLQGFVGDPAVNVVIGALIIIGGIGFPVARSLWRRAALRRAGLRRPLDLHTKLVLVTTAYLLLLGFVGVLLLERQHTLRHMAPTERLMAGVFQSLTPRTAGFNTLPIGHIAPATLLFVILLMAIGASPGSTGGGMKTTTVAALWLIARAMVSGSDRVPVFGRELPAAVRHRAVAVGALFGAGVLLGTMLLCITDGLVLADALFEVTSAFATVGLSTGVTPVLSVAGKIVITLAMYIGRLGPLSLALAVTADGSATSARFPEEHVMVG